jgi:hypothetical protein
LLYIYIYIYIVDRSNAVGIETDYGLDGRGVGVPSAGRVNNLFFSSIHPFPPAHPYCSVSLVKHRVNFIFYVQLSPNRSWRAGGVFLVKYEHHPHVKN